MKCRDQKTVIPKLLTTEESSMEDVLALRVGGQPYEDRGRSIGIGRKANWSRRNKIRSYKGEEDEDVELEDKGG